ncbi:MAG TPA: DUF6798 domain-containing protein [Candidatus Nanoarchaeia archaeon]|nr:DUF6798 domain-containing protein [Candidatus Nanoarchaeia archaeon]
MKRWTFTVIILILLAIASIFYTGYNFNSNDSVVYVPLINYYKDNSLYDKDILVDNLRIIYAPIELTFGEFFKDINVEWFFFLGFLFSRLLLVFSIFLLAYYLFKDKLVGILSVILLIGVKGTLLTLGNIKLIDSTISPWFFSLPIALFSIFFFLKKNYIIAFLLLVIINYLNLLVSLYVIAMYSFYLLVSYIQKSKILEKRKMKEVILSYIFFFVLSLPIIIGSLGIQKLSVDKGLWLDFLKLRLSHHIFPSLWPIYQFVLFGVLLYLFGVSLRYKPEERLNRKIILFLVAIGIMGIFGLIFSEVFPVPILMTAILFRSFIFFKIFVLIYIANYLINFYRKDFRKIISLQSFIFYFTIIFLLIIILVPAFVGVEKGFIYNIEYPGDKQSDEFQDISYWAEKNTDKDSLFITPPLYTGFNAFSKRSNLIDWKTAGNFLYNPSLVKTAIERIKDVCKTKDFKVDAVIFIEKCDEGYNKLNEDDFLVLKRKYGVDYIVVEKEMNFRLLYENKKFKLYAL